MSEGYKNVFDFFDVDAAGSECRRCSSCKGTGYESFSNNTCSECEGRQCLEKEGFAPYDGECDESCGFNREKLRSDYLNDLLE